MAAPNGDGVGFNGDGASTIGVAIGCGDCDPCTVVEFFTAMLTAGGNTCVRNGLRSAINGSGSVIATTVVSSGAGLVITGGNTASGSGAVIGCTG